MKNENEKENDFVRRWSKKMRAFNLLGGKCSICKTTDVRLIDFHHFENNKEKKVSELIETTWDRFWEEAKKCKAVCRNCHNKIHSIKQSRRQKEKEKILILSKKTCCKKCGNEKIYALEFHHVGKKNFCISVAVRKCIPIQVFLNEIGKCEILCRNCHALETINNERFNRLHDKILEKSRENIKPDKVIIDQEKIIDLRKNGLTLEEISKVVGSRIGSISAVLSSKDNKIAKNKDEIEILKMRQEGHSSREIAKRLKMSRGRVRYVIKTRKANKNE